MTPAVRPMRAIGLKVFYLFQITVMLSLIKAIEGLPLLELMFFRLLLATLFIAGVLAARGTLAASLATKRPIAHLARSGLAMLNMGFTFVAVRYLPLPEAITLQYTQPLFVVALSAAFLSAPVGMSRWIAVAIGFVGVLIITWPKLSLLSHGFAALSHDELIGLLAALGAALTVALTLLWVAALVRTERSTTVALWMGIFGSVLVLVGAPFGWVMPNTQQFAILLLVGALGAGAQVTLTESLRAAPASTSAPFEYSSLIFATLIGWFAFNELPAPNTLVGSTLLIGAGLGVIWHERRLMLRI